MTENSGQQSNGFFKNIFKELTQPFIDLAHTSRALFGLNLSYVIEGMTYFGIVGLLAYFSTSMLVLMILMPGVWSVF